MIVITPELLSRLSGRKITPLMRDIATAINRYSPEFGVTTKLRMAAFLANAVNETGGFTRLDENMNYSAARLKSLFGRHRISEADADRYGSSPGKKADQVAIANIIYGGPYGRKNLGNIHPGDGWNFRGSGPMQTTGRANFERAEKATGLPVVARPDMLRSADIGTLAAFVFWRDNKLNERADRGDIQGLRRIANGGNIGMPEVLKQYERALRMLPDPVKAPQKPVQTQEPLPAPKPVPAPPNAPAVKSGGLWGLIVSIILKLFGKDRA